jgi:small subunit ribosomal protein S9
MSADTIVYLGTGRRKTSTARVRIFAGTGKLTANDLNFDAYFKHDNFSRRAAAPLTTVDVKDKFDVIANIAGGGTSAQAGAVAHGIARALLKFNAELRVTLKKAGHLTRDPREKERKKPGQPGARKRFQFSKR